MIVLIIIVAIIILFLGLFMIIGTVNMPIKDYNKNRKTYFLVFISGFVLIALSFGLIFSAGYMISKKKHTSEIIYLQNDN
jgi:NADH:ubiquinone oxidoreductase subunit 6 (subunit J)